MKLSSTMKREEEKREHTPLPAGNLVDVETAGKSVVGSEGRSRQRDENSRGEHGGFFFFFGYLTRLWID